MTTPTAVTDATAPKTDRARVPLPIVAGEWVEVRSADEILATLDAQGKLDGMPFVPEMLQFCGRRLRVFKRAHKTCDTIYQSGSRSLDGSVHLDDSRCDGSAHGGCQAQCMLFWKEAWLKPLPTRDNNGRGEQGASTPMATPRAGCTLEQLQHATQVASHPDAGPRYSCQATELLTATRPLRAWDLRQYVHDYRYGNVDAATLVRGALYRVSAFTIRRTARLGHYLRPSAWLSQALASGYDHMQRLMPDGVPYPRRSGTIAKGDRTPVGDHDVRAFQPGSLVRVRSYPEILQTLDADNKNRGLYFDAENVPYCGKELRVRALVERIIDERTGHMLYFKTPSIILEGAYCRGTYSDKRMFCPRAVYPYWRPIWLVPLAEAEHGMPPHKTTPTPSAA